MALRPSASSISCGSVWIKAGIFSPQQQWKSWRQLTVATYAPPQRDSWVTWNACLSWNKHTFSINYKMINGKIISPEGCHRNCVAMVPMLVTVSFYLFQPPPRKLLPLNLHWEEVVLGNPGLASNIFQHFHMFSPRFQPSAMAEIATCHQVAERWVLQHQRQGALPRDLLAVTQIVARISPCITL